MDFLKAAKEKAQKAALALQGLSPIEITAIEATNDDKWGPHGAQMQELAKATANHEQRALIMGQLWKRLAEEKPELWRHVYKALAVFDYFIANADMAVVEELRDNMHKLKALSTFEYKDLDGKDQARRPLITFHPVHFSLGNGRLMVLSRILQGINVRHKSNLMVSVRGT